MTSLQSTRPWGVIFDVDGVLIDSYRPHLLSWQQMLRNHGLDIDEPTFQKTFGRTNPDIFREFFPSISPEQYSSLAHEKETDFRAIVRQDFPAIDGAGDLLTTLHEAGVTIGIGSSAPAENVELVLDCLPGAQWIQAVTNGCQVQRGKPAPDVFLQTAEKLSLPPNRCIVVEDAPAGVQAALNAGMKAVALTGTATPDQLAHAHLCVDSLRALTPERLHALLNA